MPFYQSVDLVTIDAPQPWAPDRFQVYQQNDILDLRAGFGAGGPTQRALRLYANGDLQVVGELFLQSAQLRGQQTLSLTVQDSSASGIVSFRAGTGPGTEQLRIESTGRISSGYEQGLALRSRIAVGASATATGFVLTTDAEPTSTSQAFLTLGYGAGVSPTNFLSIYRTGAIVMSSRNGSAAEIELDSDANSPNGKRWAITSTTDGNLEFENRTDGVEVVISRLGAFRPVTRSTDPGIASAGDIIYNTTSAKLKVYTGSAWETITSA